jgi:hypothetical protein
MKASGQQHVLAALTYRKYSKLPNEYETERSSELVSTICREKNYLPLLGNGKTALILICPVISKWF